jgi:uncharacterized membrane protein
VRFSLRIAIRSYLRNSFETFRARDAAFALSLSILSIVLFLIPTGYEKDPGDSFRCKALVVATNDSRIQQHGIVKVGAQYVEAEALDGPYKGRRFEATNLLNAKLDMDKIFSPGDIALAAIDGDGQGGILGATLVDHYRVDIELLLLCLMLFLLFLFGGWIGLKSFVSFVFTAAAVWKLLIPAFLAGVPPILASVATIIILTLAISYLAAGFTRTGTTAALGTIWGVALSTALALLFAGPIHLNGAVRPFSEMLLYAGFGHLDLRQLFLAGTFLAASGALMDLSMDVAAAMEEIHKKRPEMSRRELMASGFNVGRKVIGTMTTTLLLAYTGSFTSVLMLFMAQGLPMENMFNLTWISAEVFHTLIGSLGLVLVAPFTAIAGAFIFHAKGGRAALHEAAPSV